MLTSLALDDPDPIGAHDTHSTHTHTPPAAGIADELGRGSVSGLKVRVGLAEDSEDKQKGGAE